MFCSPEGADLYLKQLMTTSDFLLHPKVTVAHCSARQWTAVQLVRRTWFYGVMTALPGGLITRLHV